MSDVPVWVYLLTAFGVAFIGALAIWLSASMTRQVAKSTNENHAAQIDKKLQHERELSAADRKQDLDKWLLDRRLVSFERVMEGAAPLAGLSGHVQVDPGFSIDLTRLSTSVMQFHLWATDETRQSHIDFMGAAQELTAAYKQFKLDPSEVSRTHLNEMQRAFDIAQSMFMVKTRGLLGIDALA